VGCEDRDPGQQAEDSDQVDEVFEDGLGGSVHVEEGEEAEEGGEPEGVDGDAAGISTGKDAGSVSFDGETIECSGCDVKI
jgi:hypothetical protein